MMNNREKIDLKDALKRIRDLEKILIEQEKTIDRLNNKIERIDEIKKTKIKYKGNYGPRK